MGVDKAAVASRLLAGSLGGYALAQLLPVALVASLAPALPRADAVLVAMQLSFAVYALALMTAFAARSARRAWAGMLLASLGSTVIAWVAL
ncbi:hypothetical protein M2375_002831 [Comamonas sp. BIGb0152]|uniref:DUF3649 domain-containing protein n=1 Tax=Comamonas sp. BIGb0152 TaxID=2940601 RepID=UPI0021699EEE|nr:DUF3649 domain-containing protein [Comamonas sp. BIGb0152]MCS4294598.1 hypothetical protein [Comamonas sp. BIGb0152]